MEEPTTDVNFIDVVNIDSDDALEGYIQSCVVGVCVRALVHLCVRICSCD